MLNILNKLNYIGINYAFQNFQSRPISLKTRNIHISKTIDRFKWGWPFFSVRLPLSTAEIIRSLWQQEITENAAQREVSRRANRKRNCTDKPRQLTRLFHRQLDLTAFLPPQGRNAHCRAHCRGILD